MFLSFRASGGDWGVQAARLKLLFQVAGIPAGLKITDNFTLVRLVRANTINTVAVCGKLPVFHERIQSRTVPRKYSPWSEREKIEIFQPLAVAGISVCHQPRTGVELMISKIVLKIDLSINIPTFIVNISMLCPISHSPGGPKDGVLLMNSCPQSRPGFVALKGRVVVWVKEVIRWSKVVPRLGRLGDRVTKVE